MALREKARRARDLNLRPTAGRRSERFDLRETPLDQFADLAWAIRLNISLRMRRIGRREMANHERELADARGPGVRSMRLDGFGIHRVSRG
jgi:hypothetical protein